MEALDVIIKKEATEEANGRNKSPMRKCGEKLK
jgi:hypothetical protein